jgi:hypothetical protein
VGGPGLAFDLGFSGQIGSIGELVSKQDLAYPLTNSPSRSVQLQLVPNVNLGLADLPGGQFQDAMRIQTDAGNPEGGNRRPELEHLQAFAERDHIDRKPHAERMNSGGRLDENPASGIKPLLTH